MGSRTTGNGAQLRHDRRSQLEGRDARRDRKVFQSETDFVFARHPHATLQSGRHREREEDPGRVPRHPALEVPEQAAPPAAPEIAWPKIDKKLAAADPFTYLNFVLQFCPATGPAAVEAPLRARFAEIGIEAGKPFSADTLTPDQKAELEAAMKSGVEKIKQQTELLATT